MSVTRNYYIRKKKIEHGYMDGRFSYVTWL